MGKTFRCGNGGVGGRHGFCLACVPDDPIGLPRENAVRLQHGIVVFASFSVGELIGAEDGEGQKGVGSFLMEQNQR